MSDRNPLITGMGCICAAGASLDTCWENMMAGVSNPVPPTGLHTEIKRRSPVFEVLNDNTPRPFGPSLSRGDLKEIEVTRCVYFFLVALEEALKGAGLTVEGLRGQRIGVCAGTTVGCTLNDEAFYRDFKKGLNPGLTAIKRFLACNPALYLSDVLDLRGPVCTINNACSSGTDALGQAREWINDGLCDLVIAGGTDELSRIPYSGFSSLLNTSASPCRPFDVHRDGLNLGEGAGVLIVESKTNAGKRGAQALVEVAGYGTCADAYHPTSPHPQGLGLEMAIKHALGPNNPTETAFINAHGTATEANDLVEGTTLARIFGKAITTFATKGYTGHTLGAAGAIEAIFTARGLVTGKIPPSAGFSEPDPACEIVPTREAVEVKGEYALSTSLAFGGINSAVWLKAAHHAG